MEGQDQVNKPIQFNLKKKVDAKTFGTKFRTKREVYKQV